MDKARTDGIANQAAGAVKKFAGKVTGDTKLEVEGTLQQAGGKIQNAVGGARDAQREASKTNH